MTLQNVADLLEYDGHRGAAEVVAKAIAVAMKTNKFVALISRMSFGEHEALDNLINLARAIQESPGEVNAYAQEEIDVSAEEWADTSDNRCPNCESPNQFGELCLACQREDELREIARNLPTHE